MPLRLRPLIFLLLTGLLLGAVAPAVASAETRIALVIGNGDYTHVPPLPNPTADARAMAAALRAAGFELVGGDAQLNLDKAGLERAIREFGRRLGRDKIGLFYYAGHGVQVNGANYLVPVNADLATQADVKYELVDAGYVVDEMTAAGNRLNLMILDACRNNPFGGRGLRGVSRGLAQVTAPAGTLIGYATQPGDVAADGDGPNSPYTAALVRAIGQPGLGIFDTFNEVGIAVKATTNGRQQPWLSSSPIEGRFYFTPPAGVGTEAEVADAPAAAPKLAQVAPEGGERAPSASRVTDSAPGAAPPPSSPPAVRPEASPPAAASPAPGPAVAIAPAGAPPAPGITLETCPDNYYSVPMDAPLSCGCSAAATRSGSLLGDNPYGQVSSICMAARHAGAIGPQGGQVTTVPVESVPFFPDVLRNSIRSSGSDQAAPGFRVIVPAAAARPDPVGADGSITLEQCPGSYYSIPLDAPSLTCGCSAQAMSEGSLLGDNPYGRVSSICRAAQHAGALTSRGGQVTVIPVAAAPFFPATLRNGINSSGTDQGGPGFRVLAPGVPQRTSPFAADGGITLEICPDNYYSVPMDAPSLSCGCPAAATGQGSVLGDNPYGRLSGICRAALHAGALTSRGGQVTVTPVENIPFFPAVKRNGINSTGTDQPGPGFRVIVPAAAAPVVPAVAPAAPREDPRVDAAGRPVQKPIAPTLKSAGVVQVYINFVTDSADLQPSAEPVLRELLTALREAPALRVNLIGHTDSVGTSAHNQALSERRAAAVYYWLVRNGIDRDRLRSSGRGFAEPIADNATSEGRALNRRVEVQALN